MGRHVLIVEDHDDNRESLALLLRLAGLEVETARDGGEALALLRANRPCPDLILLDLCLPVVSGEEFRERQLADPNLRDIPVVALSASNDLTARAASLDIPVALQKPVSFSALYAVVARYCDARLSH